MALEEGRWGEGGSDGGVCLFSSNNSRKKSLRISASCVFYLSGQVVILPLPTDGLRKVLYLHRQWRLLHQTGSVVRVSTQRCHTLCYFFGFQLLTLGLSEVCQTLVKFALATEIGKCSKLETGLLCQDLVSSISTGKRLLTVWSRVVTSSAGSSCPFLDCLTLQMKILWSFERREKLNQWHRLTSQNTQHFALLL